MSDEASGPASSDDEDQDAWHARMKSIAEAAGIEHGGRFCEIIRPAWRSEAVSIFNSDSTDD
jgi:hypothetical protein